MFKQKYVKYKIKYNELLSEVNKNNFNKSKINNGNIKMGEDYVFQQTDNHTNIKGRNMISMTEAINKLNNYHGNK
jgi:hypothetical protein